MTSLLTPRVATTSQYETTLTSLAQSQQNLARLQEQISAQKRVLRPSDDPLAALQAERARTRMDRIEVEQRALTAQTAALTTTESTLGDATTLMQSFRSQIIGAGNPAFSSDDRASLAHELQSLRDQLLSRANQTDSNGHPLFGGLGSKGVPFAEQAGKVVYNGIAGQVASTDVGLPASLDGFVTWMNTPSGNGTFTIATQGSPASVSSDAGSVADPSAVTGHGYRISFATTDGATTYTVVDTTTHTTLQAAQPYTTGGTMAFDGLQIKVSGTPGQDAALVVAPSERNSVFDVLDRAIASIRNDSGAKLTQGIATALSELDLASNRISSARSFTGQLLNRADNIGSNQSDRSAQLDTTRAAAEDLDIIAAVSNVDTQKTMYTAALQSYAKVQQLSLFNYIS